MIYNLIAIIFVRVLFETSHKGLQQRDEKLINLTVFRQILYLTLIFCNYVQPQVTFL